MKSVTTSTTKPVHLRSTKAAIPRRSKFVVREQLRSFPGGYGGELFKARRGRRNGGRPLRFGSHSSLHLVLRSGVARGPLAFTRSPQRQVIKALLVKFATRHGVVVHSHALASNHIHLHIGVSSRAAYRRFIRAFASAVAMAVAKISRWSKNFQQQKFWIGRPFTRIVQGTRQFTKVQDYVRINLLESQGHDRNQARFLIAWEKDPPRVRYGPIPIISANEV